MYKNLRVVIDDFLTQGASKAAVRAKIRSLYTSVAVPSEDLEALMEECGEREGEGGGNKLIYIILGGVMILLIFGFIFLRKRANEKRSLMVPPGMVSYSKLKKRMITDLSELRDLLEKLDNDQLGNSLKKFEEDLKNIESK